ISFISLLFDLTFYFSSFFFYGYVDHRYLHSFPTRRSSDLQGLKIVAVAVVAHAVMGMAEKLTPDLKRKAIALFALIGTLIWQTAITQVSVILLAALLGYFLYKQQQENGEVSSQFPIAKSVSTICLLLFFGLLFLLPIIKEATGSYWIAMFDSFYRSGSLV